MKYAILAVALVASLVTVDFAEARGRRGCSSCSAGGGCPGGVCYAPTDGAKLATNAPPAPEAAVAATPAPAPQAPTVATYRRFGRRR